MVNPEPHDSYDGIEEFDNPLPAWWRRMFWASFFFAIGYMFYYHAADGESVEQAYANEMREHEVQMAEQALAAGVVDETSLAPLLANLAFVSEGKQKFDAVCAACHAITGGGSVGPNLTDRFWIHGKGTLLDIYQTIEQGVPAKGMPAWGRTLRPDELKKVVAYVGTLRGTNVSGGKAPQGE